MFDKIKTRNTTKFLSCLAKRLASRNDCRGLNYEVYIQSDGVFMDPNIKVYPSRYKRKDIDLVSAPLYIAQTHFSIYDFQDIESNFITGTYCYESSVDNKKRRWRRIN